MKFNPKTHIIGKVYDLTQENMNAMLARIEELEARLAAADALYDAAMNTVQFHGCGEFDIRINKLGDALSAYRSAGKGRK